MRAFFLLLALLFLPFPGMGTELASSIDEMLHLSVQASNVRLRAGAGTNFEVLGKASQGSKHASRYIADARTSKDRTGQPWYQLMARVEQQSDLDVIKLERPCWIRGDFVRTRPLTDEEKLKAAPLFTRTDQTLSQKRSCPSAHHAEGRPVPCPSCDAGRPCPLCHAEQGSGRAGRPLPGS